MRQQGKKSAAQVVGVALTGNIAAEPLVAQVRSERGGVVVEGVFVCVCVCVYTRRRHVHALHPPAPPMTGGGIEWGFIRKLLGFHTKVVGGSHESSWGFIRKLLGFRTKVIRTRAHTQALTPHTHSLARARALFLFVFLSLSGVQGYWGGV